MSLADVRKALTKSGGGRWGDTVRHDFPAPVVVLPGVLRLWLERDVKEYKAGRRWSPEENSRQHNSLRHLYMTLAEVRNATALTDHQIRSGRYVAPAVRVGYKVLAAS